MITRSIRVNLKIFDTLMPHLPTHLLPRSLQLQKCTAALFKTIGGSWDTFWITNGGGTTQGNAEEIHIQKALVSVRDIPSFCNHSEMSPFANSASTQYSKWRDWHSAFALTSRNVRRLRTSFVSAMLKGEPEQVHVMLLSFDEYDRQVPYKWKSWHKPKDKRRLFTFSPHLEYLIIGYISTT